MARKTQKEINYWFQDNTVKSALDLSLIEKILHINKLDIPNNIIIHKNGSTYDDFAYWYCNETKISEYPKTYEECCKNYPDNEKLKIGNLLCDLEQLLLCRDVYWKIAGEEMGLGKPWDSTYGCGEWGYWIGYSINEKKIYLQDSRILVNHTLVFPTEEMRDTFYENFKDLIEQCKTLL